MEEGLAISTNCTSDVVRKKDEHFIVRTSGTGGVFVDDGLQIFTCQPGHSECTAH